MAYETFLELYYLMVSKFIKDKNVFILIVGTVIGQGIPILATLILTRLYSPEDFGLFQVYFSLSMVFSAFTTMRYEMAIMLPKEDQDAKHILVVTLILSASASLFIGILLFFFGAYLSHWMENPALNEVLWLLPITLFAIGTYQGLYYWGNRKSLYKRIAISRVNRSVGTSFFSIAMGFFQSLKKIGLILGDTLGQFISSLFLFGWIFRNDTSIFQNIKKSKLIEVAKRYKQFPLYNVPAVILEKLSTNLPSLLLVPSFGIAVVGWFGLSQRLISLPSSIVARAYGDVFRQKVTEQYHNEENCSALFNETLKKLSLLSLPFFGLLFFIVKPLFSFFFGEKWVIAGEYAQILIPMYCLQFIASPLSNMFLVAEKQKQAFIIQVVLFIVIALGMYLSQIWFNSAKAAIVAYCIVYSIKYLIELRMSQNYSNGKRIVKRR